MAVKLRQASTKPQVANPIKVHANKRSPKPVSNLYIPYMHIDVAVSVALNMSRNIFPPKLHWQLRLCVYAANQVLRLLTPVGLIFQLSCYSKRLKYFS